MLDVNLVDVGILVLEDSESEVVLLFGADQKSRKRLGYKMDKGTEIKEPVMLDDTNLSQAVDWRTAGGVNAVKNQGHCGSCWAFSATCAVEFAHWKATSTLLSLSEQQVVSCSIEDYGCKGGW